MAKNTSTVYLGFEDECVSDKNKHLIDFTTNKVGGQPVSRSETLYSIGPKDRVAYILADAFLS